MSAYRFAVLRDLSAAARRIRHRPGPGAHPWLIRGPSTGTRVSSTSLRHAGRPHDLRCGGQAGQLALFRAGRGDDHRGHQYDLAQHLRGLAADVDQDPLRERLAGLLLNERHQQAEARGPLRDVERKLGARPRKPWWPSRSRPGCRGRRR